LHPTLLIISREFQNSSTKKIGEAGSGVKADSASEIPSYVLEYIPEIRRLEMSQRVSDIMSASWDLENE
jgi:hypothetical protein